MIWFDDFHCIHETSHMNIYFHLSYKSTGTHNVPARRYWTLPHSSDVPTPPPAPLVILFEFPINWDIMCPQEGIEQFEHPPLPYIVS